MLINSTICGFHMEPTYFSVLFLILLLFLIVYILITFVKPLEAGANVKANPISVITDNLKVGGILLVIYLVFSFYVRGFAAANFSLDDAEKVEPTGQIIYSFTIDKVEETISTESAEYLYEEVPNPLFEADRVLLKQVHDSSAERPYLEEVVCTYTRFPMEMKCNGFIFHSPEAE